MGYWFSVVMSMFFPLAFTVAVVRLCIDAVSGAIR